MPNPMREPGAGPQDGNLWRASAFPLGTKALTFMSVNTAPVKPSSRQTPGHRLCARAGNGPSVSRAPQAFPGSPGSPVRPHGSIGPDIDRVAPRPYRHWAERSETRPTFMYENLEPLRREGTPMRTRTPLPRPAGHRARRRWPRPRLRHHGGRGNGHRREHRRPAQVRSPPRPRATPSGSPTARTPATSRRPSTAPLPPGSPSRARPRRSSRPAGATDCTSTAPPTGPSRASPSPAARRASWPTPPPASSSIR